ncbi:unnamed protein product [Lymnaea stagnalis]|uniref:AIG1-type G domain-containing protein n=1 Tax=Lymnaea stagnalis TaxID=6523 RepID=A0AAV2HFF3_LYMST
MDLLLIGRSGNGKSATGNNILGSECFLKNNDSYAKSSKPMPGRRLVENQHVTVVDGLCLQEDSFTDCVRDAREALRMGNGGFTALVFVLRYGEKFGADEADLVRLAKRVFGKDVVRDYAVCVVTRGDDFKYAVEEGEETVRNFYEWCRRQTGDLKNLLHECRDRAVLFDNKTKDDNTKKNQLSEILEIVRSIQRGGVGRYTVDNFSKIHGKPLVQDSETSSAEFERKTRDKIREIGERVAIYLKDGFPDEKLRRSLQEDLRELSTSVSHTLEDEGNKLKYIRQIQDLSDKMKEKRPSHHDVDRGEAHLPQPVQPYHAGEIAQQRLDRGNGQNLHLLLLGRTGNGKSSSGNSILGKPAFKPSASTSSVTTEILSDSETIGGQLITVIDGPGLDDTEKTSKEDFLASISSVEKALDLCDYGFSAIIVVLRFGFRFTRQESDAIRLMRSILGKDVLKKYGVCLMTHGDNFEFEMTQDVEESKAMSFKEWCEAQTGDIKVLFEECNFRHVLFDNKTRDQGKKAKQRQQLLSLIPTGGCYSKDEFLASERDLVELNLAFILPKLEQKTNEELEKFRKNLKIIDRNCGTDDSEYFKQMESLLADLTEYKEMIVTLGQNNATDFFIMQLSALEVEVNTKLKLHAQSRDIQSLEVSKASQAHPVRVPVEQCGPRNAPWAPEIHNPGASQPQWPVPSFGPGSSPSMAPAQGYRTTERPFPTYRVNGALTGSEVSDVENQTMQEFNKIYAEFVSAQESRYIESRVRKTQTALDKLNNLKVTFEEIAKGLPCYGYVKSEMNKAEHEMSWNLAQERQYVPPLLVYPHEQSYTPRQVQDEGFVMIECKSRVTTDPCYDQSRPVARFAQKKQHKPLRALVQKQWVRAKKFLSSFLK